MSSICVTRITSCCLGNVYLYYQMIIVVFGLPGSGKSFFAKQLSNMLQATYISSDELRKKMFEKRSYSDKEKVAVYDEMLSKLREARGEKTNVVVDATFYKKALRTDFLAKAGVDEKVAFIEVMADEKVIKERLQKPREESDADFAVYEKIKTEWEPMGEPHLVVKCTNDNIEEMLQKAAKYLHVK